MDRDLLDSGLAAVRRAFPEARPACGLLLGSGWSEVVSDFEVRASICYGTVPGFGPTRTGGHRGLLSWATRAGIETFVFQGRRHWYEGVGWEPIALPVYLLKSLGATVMVLTNAAGGIRQDFAPTWDFPVQSFADAPYFEAEVSSIDIEYVDGSGSVTIPVQDFRLYATIAPDGESLGGARLSGLADTRSMGTLIQNDTPNAICDFAATLGVSCVDCTDGSPYCLYLEAEDLTGTLVDDVTIVPF